MNEELERLRHSLAHLLAAAILKRWPDAKPTIGPAIEHGFYYDFDFAKPISSDDLPTIEKEMRSILKTWDAASGREVSLEEARSVFTGNPYKLELIDDIVAKGEPITLYRWGTFEDLCRGGHIESARAFDPDAFTLTHLAGAYWRGSEKNPMLTRIYGLAFTTKEELQGHLAMLEEAKKRDHRKLGKELGLYAIVEEVGLGLPLFYPKGALLRRGIEQYIIEEQERKGYVPIWIPHITRKSLYELSGHLEKYDALYPPMNLEGEDAYYLKPMNCPHFMMLYKQDQHSYRELPLRWTCTTTNYRYEKSGELSGLTRVRALTQDDCHVFCIPTQIEQEVEHMLDMVAELYRVVGFADFWVRISTRDPKTPQTYIGDERMWNESEKVLNNLISSRGWNTVDGVGEAAFYGPKLDFMVRDALGREWQLSTIQLDMNLPERFDLEYVAADSSRQRPVVIHRALIGSTERFLGILIEHYAGAFPLWLAPVQVALLAVGGAHHEPSRKLALELAKQGIRAEVDQSDETVGKKIRNAEMQKVPYMLVIGDKEKDLQILAVRARGSKVTTEYASQDFIAMVKERIQSRSLELYT